MRNLKRVLSLALALVMVLGMMVITTSAADFADADEITQTEAVEVLAAIGMVEGSNGKFNPNGTFTREAAAKLITYMLGYGKTAEKLSAAGLFTDVDATGWAAGYIAFCASRGYITGNGDGTFNPSGVLTDIALGKLVLCALGFDPAKYTGDGWETAVTVDLLEEKLVSEVTGEAISREDACAMMLAAMTWTDGSDIYTVYEDKNNDGNMDAGEDIKVYTEAVDAYFAANAMGGATAKIYVDVDTSDDYLLNTVYEVVADDDPDAFGRPGTSYAHADWVAPLKYSKTPVATFNTAVSEKDFFKALGAKGEVATGKRYITVLTTTEDGQQVDHWASAADNSQAYACPGTGMQIDNNSNYRVPGTGEGITVEVYKTRNANEYTMVAIRQYMGVVTAVTKANETAGTDRTVTIRVPGVTIDTFKTESFEKGDDVLVTMADGDIKTAVAPATLKGKVTKITNGSVFTIGEQEVKLSQLNTCGAPSLNDENTWYVDAQGNLIAIAQPGRVNKYYGVVKEVGQTEYDPGTLTKKGDDTYEAVKFVDSNGDVVVLETAWTQTYANGQITGETFVIPDTLDKGDMFEYTLTADGKIASVREASNGGNVSIEITKGDAQTAGSYEGYMTDKTVVFYTDGTKTVAYTGYANIPTKDGTLKSHFVSQDGSSWVAMVVTVGTVETSTKAEYVYFGSTAKTEEITADGTVVTYTDLYVNGVKDEDGMVVVAGTPVAGGLFTFTADTKTGECTVVGSDLIDATPTEITSIQATYFIAGSAVYTDDDTVYYEINTNAKTIEVVEGLPELSNKDAYSVNLLHVDGGADADHAAKAVFFNVGA